MKPKGLFICSSRSFEMVYGGKVRSSLQEIVDIPDRAFSPEEIAGDHHDLLREVELIYTSWGGPRLDGVFLESAKKLKAVFYGAGSVKGMVTDDFWDRDILITSAAAANAIPVAEFACAQIILSLKRTWWYLRETRERGSWPWYEEEGGVVAGAYGSTIGIFSLGIVGRLVREKLKGDDIRVIAYDPHVSQERGKELDVEIVSMEELFRRSDVVTLHAPLLKETEGVITKDLFLSMKPNATFINTARGAIVDEEGMIAALLARPDLFAVLDVTTTEPTQAGSRLFTLPNVVLTPHIGGSMNNECRRMGRLMVEETERYRNNEPMKWLVNQKTIQFSA